MFFAALAVKVFAFLHRIDWQCATEPDGESGGRTL